MDAQIRNIFLYSIGKFISVFGTAIYNFALGLYVLKLTGSALSFALTLILGTIPMIIINPFAGVIADKFDKKTLVIVMDFLNGILLVSVYWVSSLFELNLTLIYSTTFFLTVFTSFFGVGIEASKPNLVSEKMLMNINSISRIIDSVSSILGPMIGGIIFVIFDIKTFIIINGISFVLSGLLMVFIDFKRYNHRTNDNLHAEKISFVRDIKEGFSYLLGRKHIMNLVTIFIFLNFSLGLAVTIPLPYIITTVLKLSSKDFGIIQGAFPMGMIMGALLVKHITLKFPYGTLLRYLSSTSALLMISLGIPVMFQDLSLDTGFYVIFYGVLMLVFGAMIALIDIPISYILQKEIPEEFRGRVISIAISTGKTMLPVAMVISGVLLKFAPSYVLPIAGGVVLLLFNNLKMYKNKHPLHPIKEFSNMNSLTKGRSNE